MVAPIEIPQEQLIAVMPHRDAVMKNFDFLYQFLGPFLTHNRPPASVVRSK